MIAGLKNNCIFELFNAKNKYVNPQGGIFYAQKSYSDLNTGYQIPTYRNPLCVFMIVLGGTGGDSLFPYILNYINFHKYMPRTVKITLKPNNSKLKSTYVARNAKHKLIR